MGRPFTPQQIDENRRFLAVLAQTGNIRLSCRAIRRAYGTMQHRRSANAGLAQEWEAALAAAHARFHLSGGRRGPSFDGAQDERKRDRSVSLRSTGDSGCARQGFSTALETNGIERGLRGPDPLRTRGGEAVVVRTRKGTLQMRFAHRAS